MQIKLEGGKELDQVAAALQRGVNEYRKSVKLVMWRSLTLLEAAITSNIRKNFKVRTGRLLNSIANSKLVNDNGSNITGEIGPVGVPYAAIHEFGGTILPKKKFLAIPLDPVLGPDGIARAKPLDFMGRSSFITMNGKLFLAVKEGNQMVPYFLMKPSVTIPARPYLRPALESKREQILKKFGLFLEANFNFDGPQEPKE